MEKTEEQIAKERDAVAAMTNAKSNMGHALERIATLERALNVARGSISELKKYISPHVYQYGDSKTSCQKIADDAIANISKVID